MERNWTDRTAVFAAARYPRAQQAQDIALPLQVVCELASRLGASAIRRHSMRKAASRQIGMYLAHTAIGLPLHVVGKYFERDRTTAAHACRLVEEKRDDAAFDAELNELEALLRAACIASGERSR